jgi:hypothetical protein
MGHFEMVEKDKIKDCYAGFEQGPIRPPNEARSLLLRVTRGCTWNRCAFCPVYKTQQFSARTAEHVKRDIDLVFRNVETIERIAAESGGLTSELIHKARKDVGPGEWEAFGAALNWKIAGGQKSVFLQDADALVVKPAELADILRHLRYRFPSVERVTSYSRARTIYRRKLPDLKALKEAGLNRIHIGLESGCDDVLKMISKGSTREIQIEAGRKVKAAGMELSEYVMPGLGGTDLSRRHAFDTADALNRINPHFIRMRTLALTPYAPLYEIWENGGFKRCNDVQTAGELLLMIGRLDGITSVITSDHILNLFEDLEGTMPDDRHRLLEILRTFLDLEPERQRLYRIGRRSGIFRGLGDLGDHRKLERAGDMYDKLCVNAENIDEVTDRLMMRFV